MSVLWAVGDDHTRTAVLDAHDQAVGAMVGWIEDHAMTRFRVNGDVVTVDAEGIVAASFRQHTSRALDPQLHTHVVIANRMLSPDGRWLALDARTLKLDQRTVSAVYHSVLRSELTNSLRVEWRGASRGIGEIEGVPDRVLDEFSVRTGQMQHRLDVKLDRFEATYERARNEKERWKLEREAAVDSRPAKTTDVDGALLHREWAERFDGLGIEPQELVRSVTGKGRGVSIDNTVATGMAKEAVGALSERSAWRRNEVMRELAAALPWNTNAPPAELERLTDLTIDRYCIELGPTIEVTDRSPVVLRRDGRPITEAQPNVSSARRRSWMVNDSWNGGPSAACRTSPPMTSPLGCSPTSSFLGRSLRSPPQSRATPTSQWWWALQGQERPRRCRRGCGRCSATAAPCSVLHHRPLPPMSLDAKPVSRLTPSTSCCTNTSATVG